ncbi:MAG: hypothetical protein B6I25_06925 [Planctomycetales bacterium 4572_13]|nr:MAG: hypothetical protein B6I25_06925 [Planctomycetales bacterium 4572_13]
MKAELQKIIADFVKVAKLAEIKIELEDISIEFLNCPHTPPVDIPKGKIAVYAFFYNQNCLKVGQFGKKSKARYTSQHYNPNSSKSNLAKNILKHQNILSLSGLNNHNISEWIKTNTDRVNILIDTDFGKLVISLMEAFLHCRFDPVFDGSSVNNRC